MNIFYKYLNIILLLSWSLQISAQKTVKIDVTNINQNTGPDCDGAFNDSDFQFELNAGDGERCFQQDGCNCAHNFDPNWDVYNTRTYFSRDCWVTGTRSIVFYSQEDDGAGSCDDEGDACSRTDNWTFPAYNATNGTYQQNGSTAGSTTLTNANCTNGGCPNINYSYTANWVIGGSYTANNLNASGYAINTNCANAINITAGNRTNDANQCTEAWYYYDVSAATAATLSNVTFNGANGTITVWLDATSSCNLSCQLASAGGGVSIGGPFTAGRFYIRVSANGSTTNINRSTTIGANSNDYIANATNMGNLNLSQNTQTFDLTAENNIGSWYETSEPWINQSDEDKRTDWYSFTTGNNPP